MIKQEKSNLAAGLSISDYSLELVISEEIGGKVKVLGQERLLLEPGAVVKGRAVNQPYLAARLAEAFSKFGNFDPKKDRIVFSLPDALNFLLVFYEADEAKITGRLREECSHNIPLDPKQAEISHRIFFNREEKYYRVIASAVSRKDKKGWQQFFSRLGYRIEHYDIEVLANFRALFNSYPRDCVALLDIGSRTANLSVYNSNGLSYACLIPYAGDYFSDKLAKALKVEWPEAERVKIKYGLENDRNPEAAVVLRSAMEHYVIEIKRYLDYYASAVRPGQQVSRLYVLGGSCALKGLKEFFQARIRAEINVCGKDRQDTLFLNAQGAALKALDRKWQDIDPDFSNGNSGRLHWLEAGALKEKIRNHLKIASAGVLAAIAVIVVFSMAIKYASRPEPAGLPPADVQAPAATTSPEDLPGPQIRVRVKEIGVNLNLRSGPGTQFSVIGQAPPGSRYGLLEEGEDWLKISFDSKEAWAYRQFLDIIEE